MEKKRNIAAGLAGTAPGPRNWWTRPVRTVAQGARTGKRTTAYAASYSQRTSWRNSTAWIRSRPGKRCRPRRTPRTANCSNRARLISCWKPVWPVPRTSTRRGSSSWKNRAGRGAGGTRTQERSPGRGARGAGASRMPWDEVGRDLQERLAPMCWPGAKACSVSTPTARAVARDADGKNHPRTRRATNP